MASLQTQDFSGIPAGTSLAGALLTSTAGDPIARSIVGTNLAETDPVFFGVISSVPFATLRLLEPAETGGFGNEEVSIDDLVAVAATTVPEPSAMLLVASGLVAIGLSARRRRTPSTGAGRRRRNANGRGALRRIIPQAALAPGRFTHLVTACPAM